MKRLPLVVAALWVLLPFRPCSEAVAQPTYPGIVHVRVHVEQARAYVAPRTDSDIVAVFPRDLHLIAVEKLGPYYKVTRLSGGAAGYVLGAHLQRIPETEMEAFRQQAALLPARARFDLYGGAAFPQSEAFAQAYRPGLNVGVRMSYRVAGPLALAARFSHSRFVLSESPADTRSPAVRGEAVSLLAGALGIDLNLIAAGPLRLLLVADGGVYQAIVDESAPVETAALEERPVSPVFAEDTFTRWGGNVGLRLSIRLGTTAQFFAEPSYEVILTEPNYTRYTPVRVGVSLGR